MTKMRIRDVDLFMEVVGSGPPMLLMHGGPGADHWTLNQFRRLADEFTLVFYDHRCNGRSDGPPVESMTWENLIADADALRERLGFERWAVLGHSFGGTVALEYALRCPDRVSQLILLDTGGDAWWPQHNAAELLARRGYSPKVVRLVHRFFNGQVASSKAQSSMFRFGTAYFHRRGLSLLWVMARDLVQGEWRSVFRGEPLVFAGRHLFRGWSVMDRLGEIRAPTLVIAGRDDFLFPPEHQAQLAAGIPDSRLEIIERAGHNPHSEETAVVMEAVRSFLATSAGVARAPSRSRAAATSTA
jgi:proline iminopeptidase